MYTMSFVCLFVRGEKRWKIGTNARNCKHVRFRVFPHKMNKIVYDSCPIGGYILTSLNMECVAEMTLQHYINNDKNKNDHRNSTL